MKRNTIKQLKLVLGGGDRNEPSQPSILGSGFGAHLGISPRHTWFKKAFDRCQNDPLIFEHEDATIRLGCSQNMVKAMRYWAIAFKILEEVDYPKRGVVPTEFGRKLLGPNGWDEFLEDLGSWWLLHWKLLQPPCYAPSWYQFFCKFYQPEFRDRDVIETLGKMKAEIAPARSQSAVRMDLRCLLQMYVPQDSKNIELMMDYPFWDLQLIYRFPKNPLDKEDHYEFRVGSKMNLPPAVAIACCLDYAARMQPESIQRIRFSELLFGECAPGLVFKLTESALHDAIDKLKHPALHFTQDAEYRAVLAFDKPASMLADEILDEHYR